ncbi:amidase domain-containing protein [Streptomyces sp. NPDC052236]|uniref:amidase domain-containing protein n=1 Tax=Streptomyces sp. NPDC052236 TaxID=3365686 RepID=UPI0037D71CEB
MRSETLSSHGAIVAIVALSIVSLPLPDAHAADGARVTIPQVTRATNDTFGRVADAVLTDRTAALLDRSQVARQAPRFAAGGVRLSAELTKKENGALSSLADRRSRLGALNEAYSAADTKVTVDKTTVQGPQATIQVTETTTLTYEKIRGDEPATTGFTAHHELTFTAQPNGTWGLSNIRRTDKGPRPVNEPAPTAPVLTSMAVIDAPRAATNYPAPANPKKKTGTGYNYTAMATYAEKHWKNYNPEYRSFSSAGGDCTNFVSQSLKAGAWKPVTTSNEDYGTWHYGTSGQSVSWIGVNEWSWFTQTAKRSTALANVYQLDIGDVMQMDFDKDGSKDHTMMTTYRSASGVPYLTYHDTNTYRRSLSSIIASYPNSTYYGYRT